MTTKPIPRLGRGLAALMGEVSAAPTEHGSVGSGGVQALPLDAVEPGPFQPRTAMNEAAQAELTESVRARGILQPILVRPHPVDPTRYQIIAGERRWRAAQAAGLTEVPSLVRPLGDADALAAALVENLQRQDLNPIEEAEGYQRLLDEFGLQQDALAEAVGKSRSHVTNTLRLLNLPKSVQADVRSGNLSAGHARLLVNHPDPETVAIAVIARGLNVRQTEALMQRRPVTAPQLAEKDPETAATERLLTERLGLKVSLRFDGKAGVLAIHYRSLDQLDSLVQLLTRN
ncbi:MAG TPA: ParB/RepB/Spo0J family partition protein [Acetobacteraceae bacterium]|nr:ParB/RepB/Spo0J family partition protein [Acetobacteraceae bacterium]